ncbi:histidine kinase [Flavobacterium columnare]|uniref:ATP-binding protein n=1 Tax=Flavobacterium columnare TaxID=996 RepID=UPI0007F9C723|nr:ATP-binding protein [Flavobacterium columnare]ANO48459.1 histidine kinase [Flavobacterium columnare]APT23480.1 ATP-binding protein [Flavobacterium columnare]
MAQFKTRARALDLLGRQQIAGIPTAINELIKNAHDAYADKFDIDFLRKENLLILRDDGLGMTKEEFETRWLTIGTESKFLNNKTSLPPKDNTKPLRPVMGEKGIGRLAIASIGKQVLIISKAKQREKEYKIVAAFINWELFELPGINLEDIIIPIEEFDEIPDLIQFHDLKQEVLNSLIELKKKNIISDEDYERIALNVINFDIDPKILNSSLVGDFKLSKNNGGTFFYINPVSETLIFDIEGDKETKEATKIEKMLIGFHNTMTPNHPTPVIDISFRDYRANDGTYYNIIDKEQFFNKDEFELGDHHFQGTFDEYGQFNGLVKIYREKSYNHIVNWNGNNFKLTDCGSFNINLAYLQGDPKSSLLDPENYSIIKAKGDKFGGLYIYKDNIRVLPYGDSDYDFLDIEKNRSKRAGTYFFSYRRMFGVIEINSISNNKLIEKAGREGFIENKAFHQLQDILKNFFVQLAADFFDDKGKTPQSEFFNQKKDERNSIYKALERRDKLSKVKKEKFIQNLDTFFKDLTSNKFKQEVDTILDETKKNLNSVIYIKDTDEASQRIIDYEFQARQKLNDYRKKISISGPKGFTISKGNRLDFETYLKEFQLLEQNLFNKANQEIDALIQEYIDKLKIEISKRKRLEQAVEFISIEAKKTNTKKRNETNEIVSDVSNKIKQLTSDLMLDLDNQIRSVKDRFKHLSTDSVEDFNLVEERKSMENEIELISNRNTFVMDRIIRQFESFYIEKDNEGQIITNDQISDAMSEELEELRDRVQADIELSQLGLAVGILHHEFSSTVRSIRGSIKDLKAWSDVNQQLDSVYKNIKVNFEHLDGYLNLFTPLNRRLNRKREDISLMEIKLFLIDLFKSRMERHNIEFKHTKGFATQKINGFRSTFYPVFVNLIDNAIYWLNHSNVENKIIRMHADESGIYISNNGIEIPIQDRERIFDLGFSRKQNGRGMGLSISKEVLNAENFEISTVSPREGSTVTFRIVQNKSDNNE